MDLLRLEQPDRRLRQRVVVRVPRAADRRLDAGHGNRFAWRYSQSFDTPSLSAASRAVRRRSESAGSRVGAGVAAMTGRAPRGRCARASTTTAPCPGTGRRLTRDRRRVVQRRRRCPHRTLPQSGRCSADHRPRRGSPSSATSMGRPRPGVSGVYSIPARTWPRAGAVQLTRWRVTSTCRGIEPGWHGRRTTFGV